MAISETLRKVVLNPRVLFPIALAIGGIGGYFINTQNRENEFGVRVPAVCGLSGTIPLPKLPEELNSKTDITVIIHGKSIKVDPKGNFSGQFHIGPERRPFFVANVDGGKQPDRIYVDYEDGVFNYYIECVEQPTPTPTPEKPATPTPLSSKHDRLTAYQRGFNRTKPAGRGGRGGTIFRRRG